MEKRSERTTEIYAHQAWIGFVQPVGLVVSIPALEKAQCFVQRNVQTEQQALRSLCTPSDDPARATDLGELMKKVLGYADGDLQAAGDRFSVSLPEYQDQLRPTSIIIDPDDEKGATALVMELAPDAVFDDVDSSAGWTVSPQLRFERLLRETKVPVGLLFNQLALRLVYMPRGESSGHATFAIREMVQVAGRPILGGLLALLSADRVLNLGKSQRLPAILEESRKYQSVVSTLLSEQVLGALHELVRGFQTAHDVTEGKLLEDVLREAPTDIYGGLVTTLLRLVFVLFAEDQGLLPKDAVYVRHYAVGALFDKLREDAARYPDTMDQRYGCHRRL